jgi:choline dehydrogenase-like flavoprotein
MRLQSEQGVAVDWPVEYADLVRRYEEVERFLGFSGPASYPWDPGRRYPLPPLALNTAAHTMQRGV